MKRSEIKTLGLLFKTIREYNEEVDHVQLIVSDEFNRPIKKEEDYRDTAIYRLVKNNLSFYNEQNLSFLIMKKFVKIVCPYCGKEMQNSGCGSGNNEVTRMRYSCSCGAKANLSFRGEDAITFEPRK
jgi:hypothetical protein